MKILIVINNFHMTGNGMAALGKPLTATYHIHPENITCHGGPLYHWNGFNSFLLRLAGKYIYNHCAAV